MPETLTPEPNRKISPSKLLGDSPALGNVGQGGESKVGKLARIVRHNRIKINDNEKKIQVNVDKLMGVEEEQEQIHETLFSVVEKQGELQQSQKGGAGGEAIENLAANLDSIAKELSEINSLLALQTKTQEANAKKAQQAALREKRAKDEKDKESKSKPKKSGMQFKTPRPVVDFFDKIKNFFKQVLLGSVVVGILKWLKDPNNKKKINDVIDFVADNVPIILTGLLAIVGIGIGAKLITFMTTVIGLGKSLIALMGPTGLMAILGAGGIVLTLLGMKAGVDNVVRPLVYGTDKEMADYKQETIQMARAAGLNEKTGEPGHINARGRFVPANRPRTAEEEKVWQEVQRRDKVFEEEKVRRKDIESRRNTDIKAAEERSSTIQAQIREDNTTQTSRGGKLSDQGQTLLAQEKARLESEKQTINRQYDEEKKTAPAHLVDGEKKVETPNQSPATWQDSMFDGEAKTKAEISDEAVDKEALAKLSMSGEVIENYFNMRNDGDFSLGAAPNLTSPMMKLEFSDMKPSVKPPVLPPPEDTKDKVLVLGPDGKPAPQNGAISTPSQNVAPTFSPYDLNNDTLAPVMAVYNATQ